MYTHTQNEMRKHEVTQPKDRKVAAYYSHQ